MRIRLEGGRIEVWIKWNKERWEERKGGRMRWKEGARNMRWWMMNIEMRKNKKTWDHAKNMGNKGKLKVREGGKDEVIIVPASDCALPNTALLR